MDTRYEIIQRLIQGHKTSIGMPRQVCPSTAQRPNI